MSERHSRPEPSAPHPHRSGSRSAGYVRKSTGSSSRSAPSRASTSRNTSSRSSSASRSTPSRSSSTARSSSASRARSDADRAYPAHRSGDSAHTDPHTAEQISRRRASRARAARERARRQRRRRNCLLLLLVILAALYAFIHSWYRAPEMEETPPPKEETTEKDTGTAPDIPAHQARKPGFYTILLSGTDDGNGGSDTNILVAVDTEGGCIHGVSIPRDTKAIIDGRSRKINFAYNKGGTPLMAETISHQLGIPVDFTVTVDLEGFQALVDELGGVEFDVPLDMDYDDPYQDLHIHIGAGVQRLDGESAMKVVRFRHNNDGSGYVTQDIGRIETQQAFLKAVARQTLRLSNVDKISGFAKIFRSYVDTDLELGNLIWLGGQAIRMGPENIGFSTLPGEWHAPYIYLDEEAVLTLVNEYLNPYEEDRLAEDLDIPS